MSSVPKAKVAAQDQTSLVSSGPRTLLWHTAAWLDFGYGTYLAHHTRFSLRPRRDECLDSFLKPNISPPATSRFSSGTSLYLSPSRNTVLLSCWPTTLLRRSPAGQGSGIRCVAGAVLQSKMMSSHMPFPLEHSTFTIMLVSWLQEAGDGGASTELTSFSNKKCTSLGCPNSAASFWCLSTWRSSSRHSRGRFLISW